jgi:hypothetical protein
MTLSSVTKGKDRLMRFAMGIISVCMLTVMALYLIDMFDSVNIINLHEVIPLRIFGVIWAIIGLVIIVPMYNFLEKREKDDG